MVIVEPSTLKIQGQLTCNMWKRGELLWTHTQSNQITSTGVYCVAAFIAGVSGFEITQFGFGDGTTAATSSDTEMDGEWYRLETDFIDRGLTTTEGYNKAKIYWRIDYNNDISGKTFYRKGGGSDVWTPDLAFTIKEFSLWSFSDTIFNRIVWAGPDLVMDTDMTLDGNFQITVSI